MVVFDSVYRGLASSARTSREDRVGGHAPGLCIEFPFYLDFSRPIVA